MANRRFTVAAGLSTAVLGTIVAAWIVAGDVDPRKQFVSLSRECHLSVSGGGASARLHVFSNSRFGPYCGSIVGFAEDPNRPSVDGFGDFAGIYYRMIRWPDGSHLWTLSLSLFYPLALAAVLPSAWLFRAVATSAAELS